MCKLFPDPAHYIRLNCETISSELNCELYPVVLSKTVSILNLILDHTSDEREEVYS